MIATAIREITMIESADRYHQSFDGYVSDETYVLTDRGRVLRDGSRNEIRIDRFNASMVHAIQRTSDPLNRPCVSELATGEIVRLSFPDGRVRDFQISGVGAFADVWVECHPDAHMVTAKRIVILPCPRCGHLDRAHGKQQCEAEGGCPCSLSRGNAYVLARQVDERAALDATAGPDICPCCMEPMDAHPVECLIPEDELRAAYERGSAITSLAELDARAAELASRQ